MCHNKAGCFAKLNVLGSLLHASVNNSFCAEPERVLIFKAVWCLLHISETLEIVKKRGKKEGDGKENIK